MADAKIATRSSRLLRSALLMIFAVFLQFADGQADHDSLWGVWNDESAPDSARCLAMHKIFWEGYLYSQPDSAFFYARMLYDFARERELKKEMARALNTQGVSYYVRSDYIKAMDYYKQSLRITEESSDKKRMASVLNNIGLIYSRKGYNPKALDYYQRSLAIYEEIGDKSRMAGALNNIGVICIDQKDYPLAMDYFQRCLKISEEVFDKILNLLPH